MVNIKVRTLSGKAFSFEFDVEKKTVELKNLVFKETGIPPFLQKIIFNDKELKCDNSFKESGIEKDSEVFLIINHNVFYPQIPSYQTPINTYVTQPTNQNQSFIFQPIQQQNSNDSSKVKTNIYNQTPTPANRVPPKLVKPVFQQYFQKQPPIQTGGIFVAQPVQMTTLPVVQKPEEKKKRRGRYCKSACTNCRKAHACCDNQRPCSRCRDLGLAMSCTDAPRKRTKKKSSKKRIPKKNETVKITNSRKNTTYLDNKSKKIINIRKETILNRVINEGKKRMIEKKEVKYGELPFNVLLTIFKFADQRDILNLRLCSKKFKDLLLTSTDINIMKYHFVMSTKAIISKIKDPQEKRKILNTFSDELSKLTADSNTSKVNYS